MKKKKNVKKKKKKKNWRKFYFAPFAMLMHCDMYFMQNGIKYWNPFPILFWSFKKLKKYLFSRKFYLAPTI